MKTMIKTIMLLFILGSAACAPLKEPYIPAYKLVSSTCGVPETDLSMSHIVSEVANTSFYITQKGSKTCSFYVTGVMEGNDLTLVSGQVISGNCHIDDLVFEDNYTLTQAGNAMTLSSASCVNEFQVK